MNVSGLEHRRRGRAQTPAESAAAAVAAAAGAEAAAEAVVAVGGRGGNAGPPNEPDGTPRAAGFGVRVIHGGVWGFASSPIVTEDEIRRITRLAIDVAKASAIAKKRDVQLAPTPAYQVYWSTRDDSRIRRRCPTPTSARTLQAAVDAAIKHKDVVSATANVGFSTEWKYFASSEGSYIEQEIFSTMPSFTVTAKRGDVTRSRNLDDARRHRRLGARRRGSDAVERRSHRRRGDRAGGGDADHAGRAAISS